MYYVLLTEKLIYFVLSGIGFSKTRICIDYSTIYLNIYLQFVLCLHKK